VRQRIREIGGRVGNPLRRMRRKDEHRPRGHGERKPDQGPRLESLDDWILFGPPLR
jgi:ribosomal protein L19E